MMSVTQESVKSAFCMQFPEVCQSQGKFSYIFVINRHFGGHFVCILILFFIFLSEVKCLQLDSNFKAITLREKWVYDIFPYHTMFSLIIGLHLGRHLGYIEMLNDARVASLGFVKDMTIFGITHILHASIVRKTIRKSRSISQDLEPDQKGQEPSRFQKLKHISWN